MANPFDEVLGKAEDKAHYEAVGRTTAVVTHLPRADPLPEFAPEVAVRTRARLGDLAREYDP